MLQNKKKGSIKFHTYSKFSFQSLHNIRISYVVPHEYWTIPELNTAREQAWPEFGRSKKEHAHTRPRILAINLCFQQTNKKLNFILYFYFSDFVKTEFHCIYYIRISKLATSYCWRVKATNFTSTKWNYRQSDTKILPEKNRNTLNYSATTSSKDHTFVEENFKSS